MASQQPKARNSLSLARAVFNFRQWWREDVIGTINQQAVIEKRRFECEMSARYIFMTAMSGGIAILGLLLSSPAVVIGAMLLSPLMDPIIGLGFALAVGDYKWLRQAAKSLAWGTIVAVGLCAMVVYLSPLQEVTSEIASRTRPNLFDLLVALFSALAGAYAMIRGREGTIVGVAIATALMPPLAVIGFGLATANWTVFSGALLLYITNLMAIALTAALMARLYGFRTALSERHTQLQNVTIVIVFVALAVPLAFSLRQIAWEANAERQIRNELLENFADGSRLATAEINWDAEPITVDATIVTPEFSGDAEARGSRAMSRILGQPISLIVTQIEAGTGARSAEQAQLNAARDQEEAAAEQVEDLTARLALIAGVPQDDVLVDRQRRRALVKAVEIEGATLGAYAALEKRISSAEPDWRIELVPPAKSLPAIPFNDGEPTEEGTGAIKLIVWAAARVDAPIILSGDPQNAALAESLLKAEGLPLVTAEPGGRGQITARWGSIER